MTPHAIRLVAGLMNAGKDKGVMLKAADRIAELEQENERLLTDMKRCVTAMAFDNNINTNVIDILRKSIRKEIEK